jgi:hypothetical protein
MLYYRAAATEEGHSQANHGSFSEMMRRANVLPEMLTPEYASIIKNKYKTVQ